MYTATTITISATISHRLNSPTRMPDMVSTSRNRRGSRADRLEFSNLFRQRPLDRKPLHRGSSIKAVTIAGVLHDECGIRRLGHRSAMREHDDLRIDAKGRRRPGVDAIRTILEFQRGLRADRAAGG